MQHLILALFFMCMHRNVLTLKIGWLENFLLTRRSSRDLLQCLTYPEF